MAPTPCDTAKPSRWRIYASANYASIGCSDNGLAPNHYLNQYWFVIKSIGPPETNFQWNFNHNRTVFIQNVLKVSYAKRQPYCFGLNLLSLWSLKTGSVEPWLCSCTFLRIWQLANKHPNAASNPHSTLALCHSDHVSVLKRKHIVLGWTWQSVWWVMVVFEAAASSQLWPSRFSMQMSPGKWPTLPPKLLKTADQSTLLSGECGSNNWYWPY